MKNQEYPAEVFNSVIRDAIEDWSDYHEISSSLAYTQLLTLMGQFFSDSIIVADRVAYHPNIYSVGVANRGTGKSHVVKNFKKMRDAFFNLTLTECTSGDEGINLNINIGDTTPAKLLENISNNQKMGINNRILVYRDEGSALFGSFGAFEKSTGISKPSVDQLVYMSGFTGEIESSERVCGSRIIKESSNLSLMTTIQPKFLQTFFVNKDDGFTDRFIFAFNDVEKEIYYRECSEEDENIFYKKVDKMNDFIISLFKKGTKRKYRLYFENQEDRDIHITMVRSMTSQLKEELGEKTSKFLQYYFKFVLLLAILRDKETITLDITEDAMKLMEYYIASTKRLEVYADEGVGFIHDKIIDYLKKNGSTSISFIINRCVPLQTHIKWKYADTKQKKENAKATATSIVEEMVTRGLLDSDGDKYFVKEDE